MEEEKLSRRLRCSRPWEELVLPWLSPRDLVAAAATCKLLRRAAESITTRRSSDASRGLECHTIPFVNDVDSQPYAYFLYSRHSILSSSSIRASQPWGGSEGTTSELPSANGLDWSAFGVGFGCCCSDCSSEPCPCSLSFSETGEGLGILSECGAGCRCGVECGNRATQRGVRVRLKIVKHPKKGWGLHAAQFVPKGEFVCEYAGEFLTVEETQKRQRRYDDLANITVGFSPALLIVREHLPSDKSCLRVNIDATRIGSIARFINHSCNGGNLSAVLVRNAGSLLPRLCFFAGTDLLDEEELTFSYGDTRVNGQNGRPCFCGTEACSGLLPSEDT